MKEDLKTVIVRSVVRPADTLKNRNRRVTFKDEVDSELNKLDDEYKHSKSLKPVDNKDKNEDEEDDEDLPKLIPRSPSADNEDEGIHARTRSKKRTVGALKLSTIEDINKDKDAEMPNLMKISTMIFFILFQFLMWMPHKGSNGNSIIESHGDYKASITNKSDLFIDQLKYLNALDKMNDMVANPWDTLDVANKELWEVKRVLKHRQKAGETEVKVTWNDPNKLSSWIDMYSFVFG